MKHLLRRLDISINWRFINIKGKEQDGKNYSRP
jgi:hypothetical protein